ncbi:MAG: peptide chain release factor N(5)-glutamine methyltransferase [Patescibacteria group bacterium]
MEVNDLLLLAKIRGLDYQDLLLKSDFAKVNPIERDLLADFKRRIARGYPMAYLLGKIKFAEREFQVSDNVLIPRPETEDWVNFLSADLSRNLQESNFQSLNILEVGTGSGVIGLTLTLNLDKYINEVLLTDISNKAIRICVQNTEDLVVDTKLRSKINFQRSDLLERLGGVKFINGRLSNKTNQFNLLVANLPYLPDNDRKLPAFRNLKYEPGIALYAGYDGLNLFRKLIQQIFQKNYSFNEMWFELDPRNIHSAKEYVSFVLPDYETAILEDFNHFDRVLVVKKSSD